jgi:alanyl-tRNA synthetase
LQCCLSACFGVAGNKIGDGFSREFCGGTHLTHTGQIGFFKIMGEEAVGKGVGRLTCVTARESFRLVLTASAVRSTSVRSCGLARLMNG